ncbi:uncharacterized protein LOC131064186 isoform X3 [Cryptomeria japonica]|uniref:uncharacterized protein LOC131064186 isoform X3 n=1 Tax=Cryptomeria japonica TaxID=3369 RepID=UPI0025AD6ABE|nr:uncharacterized protein LOC131064186 isoform X3 [Cryptomeria japonica]XP_057854205.1 uncharacterized protein LOC131064186 isoform X3 [Cryptomeria japonica]XP_057854206.1 uncharacterized protein LOC131064186 isoform X3 [Cryptomeria japonica]
MEDPNPCERAKKWLQSLQKIENMNKIDPREAPISLDSSNIYEGFVFRGLQIDQLQEGRALCTFKVPPRLVDGNGIWPARVIMSLVDNVCAAAIMTCDKPVKVSVDYNLSYFSTAKTHDENGIWPACVIMSLADNVCGAAILTCNKPSKVSVDYNLS